VLPNSALLNNDLVGMRILETPHRSSVILELAALVRLFKIAHISQIQARVAIDDYRSFNLQVLLLLCMFLLHLLLPCIIGVLLSQSLMLLILLLLQFLVFLIMLVRQLLVLLLRYDRRARG